MWWRILVFLTGGLALYLVIILVAVMGLSLIPWQYLLFMAICGLVYLVYYIAREYEKGKAHREWLRKYKRKLKQEELNRKKKQRKPFKRLHKKN